MQRVLHGRAEKIPYKNKKTSVPKFGTASRQVNVIKLSKNKSRQEKNLLLGFVFDKNMVFKK